MGLGHVSIHNVKYKAMHYIVPNAIHHLTRCAMHKSPTGTVTGQLLCGYMHYCVCNAMHTMS